MRIVCLLKGDIRQQWKYGFYGLYLILTLIYAGVLSILPSNWKVIGTALICLLYTSTALTARNEKGEFDYFSATFEVKTRRELNLLIKNLNKIPEIISIHRV